MKLPKSLNLKLRKFQDLRYGENPHQKSGFYVDGKSVGFKQLWGLTLSYNNLEDAYGAWRLVSDFKEPTVAIIKHGNPSGIATRKNLVEAYELAYDADQVSAFGGIVALNRGPTLEMIEEMRGKFYELIIAPDYSKKVFERLKKRSNKMRVIRAKKPNSEMEVKRIFEGFLVQSPDDVKESPYRWKVVSGKKPGKKILDDCVFANKIVKHVKSNAIVIANNLALCGVGIGQPNRVNSVNLATKQAGKKTKGAIMASDAFFPFDDNVKLAAKKGISVILQPGGSIRDEEVIATAKKLGISMIFTGVRHFRH